jgi:hypothetical protein
MCVYAYALVEREREREKREARICLSFSVQNLDQKCKTKNAKI